jgi:hypothetical protein
VPMADIGLKSPSLHSISEYANHELHEETEWYLLLHQYTSIHIITRLLDIEEI